MGLQKFGQCGTWEPCLTDAPEGGEPEERGDEANETQSRGSIQGPGGLGGVQGRQDAGRIGGTIWRASHPDYRMEAAFSGTGRRRVWRHDPEVGCARSQGSSCQNWATGTGK